MTRLVLMIDPPQKGLFMTEDCRTTDELVKIINTGRLVVGQGVVVLPEPVPQRALALPERSTVAVLNMPPPLINATTYEAIFGLARGLTLDQIAAKASVSRRAVYYNLEDLKQRWNVSTTEQILIRAVEMGIL